MQDICEHIEKANRLFAFGTGEAQNAAAQIIKRMFMYAKRFFVTFAGKSELTMALEDLEPNDFMIIISLSGENELAVKAAKKAKGKGAYLLSLTGLNNNTLARLSDKSLYITTNHEKGTAQNCGFMKDDHASYIVDLARALAFNTKEKMAMKKSPRAESLNFRRG